MELIKEQTRLAKWGNSKAAREFLAKLLNN